MSIPINQLFNKTNAGIKAMLHLKCQAMLSSKSREEVRMWQSLGIDWPKH